MRLLIHCDFDGGPQTLIKENATEDDAAMIREAMNEAPDVILSVDCRLTPDGPDRNRLIRVGAIQSVAERQIMPLDEV
jgi:hypothetical protein